MVKPTLVAHEHMWLVWGVYIIGLCLHVLMAASATAQDPTSSIKTVRQYLHKYGVEIIGRVFVLLCAFPFIWDNPGTVDIEGMIKSHGAQVAFSGIAGFFCDSVVGQALKIFGVSNKLPALPGEPKSA